MNLVVRLDELSRIQTLLEGSSDLAELNRASAGELGAKMVRLFNEPIKLPIGVSKGLQGSVGSPLVREALLATTALVQVDGLPADLSGAELSEALSLSQKQGEVTLLSLLRAWPGRRATINVQRALFKLDRLQLQQEPARSLLIQSAASTPNPEVNRSGPLAVQRRDVALHVPHREQPLRSVVLMPRDEQAKGLVFISHGLWDSPVNFEGWGHHLAGHGYAVLIPQHPGSDQAQQAAMLTGAIPPPAPEELGLRPRDISALLAAVDRDRLALGPIPTEQVIVVGHSWGGITALQLAGLKSSDERLLRRCGNLDDPEANVSWVLQCSFLRAASRESLAEPRVRGVVAVSPPLRLLFDRGAAEQMHGRALVVSGSMDWVVPFGPEALTPFQEQPEDRGHQLVLAGGGTHFNLRSGPSANNAVLRGLILSWVRSVFAAGEAARPSAGAPPLLPDTGWGDPTMSLVEATPDLATSR